MQSKYTLPNENQRPPITFENVFGEVATRSAGDLAKYIPAAGLQAVAEAETGEKRCQRARDVEGLFREIAAKLKAQAEYVIWRDAAHAVVRAGPGRGKKQTARARVVLPEEDPGQDVIDRWRKALCSKIKGIGTVIDHDKVRLALGEAQHRCLRVCEHRSIGLVRRAQGTGNNEWNTPFRAVELAQKLLGQIDLDPASSAEANEIIKAARIFTKQDDGLAREWHGRVWLNPPYSKALIGRFVAKLIAEFKAGRVTQAIMLTHNCTDTTWFHEARAVADAICFPRGRIGFENPDGKIAEPTQGQAFFYFGPNAARFSQIFETVGFVQPRAEITHVLQDRSEQPTRNAEPQANGANRPLRGTSVPTDPSTIDDEARELSELLGAYDRARPSVRARFRDLRRLVRL